VYGTTQHPCRARRRSSAALIFVSSSRSSGCWGWCRRCVEQCPRLKLVHTRRCPIQRTTLVVHAVRSRATHTDAFYFHFKTSTIECGITTLQPSCALWRLSHPDRFGLRQHPTPTAAVRHTPLVPSPSYCVAHSRIHSFCWAHAVSATAAPEAATLIYTKARDFPTPCCVPSVEVALYSLTLMYSTHSECPAPIQENKTGSARPEKERYEEHPARMGMRKKDSHDFSGTYCAKPGTLSGLCSAPMLRCTLPSRCLAAKELARTSHY
jgi:hypothetical protein